jgi:glycosyltransferase 2 family protein
VRFVTAPWFRAGLSVALLGYLASQIDMAETARATLAINPAHLLTAVALVVVDRVLMLSRWLLLVRRAGMALPLKSAVWVYLVGSYLGNFLPSGIGADAARAFVLARRTDRGIDSVAMVAIDRYLGLYSLALLAVVGLVLWTGQGEADLQRWSIALAMVVTLGAGVFLWADRLLPLLVPTAWATRPWFSRAGRLAVALGGYRRYPSLLGALTTLSLVVQIVRVAQAYVLGEGLGFHVPFSYYLAFMPIGILAILLPVSIGGFGFGQGVIVALLRPVGVPDAQSLAMSTLYVLMGVLSTLPGALLHFRSRSRGLS